ncbi:MAG: FAD-dependent oxidoreductase [Pseudomonadales bacterium]|nr:FAD-dependent oxidoreductase [Pseudomonadales bacterium]
MAEPNTSEPKLPSDPTAGADAPAATRLDAIIVGGGIAGLWLLNLLTRRGYDAVLFEADTLGGGQTLASQGMIHGGIKYALAGLLTRASEAIADMPERWAAALAGRGDVDLSGLAPLSDRYYMFAEASSIGQLTTFFASRAVRGRIRKLERRDHPAALIAPGFRGVVYVLRDFVLDTPALLQALLRPVADRAFRLALPDPGTRLAVDATGVVLQRGGHTLAARHLILTAGAGTEALLWSLGLETPHMQRRPLHQVIVRHPGLTPLFAHCLTGIRRPEPRLTITSHRDGNDWLWYLGGQIATDGVAMGRAELIEHARRELEACLPWRDWREADIDTLRVDRAEPARAGGVRPDEAFVEVTGPGDTVIVGWPTKLSLAPDLGDRVLERLPAPRADARSAPGLTALDLPRARIGTAPWER